MFKNLLGIILLAPSLTFAAKPTLELAHKKGFVGCDAGITKAFEYVDGDVRANISTFKQTMKDSVQLTAAGGKPGDSVFVSANFRLVNKVCYWRQTSIISVPKSCDEYRATVPAFKFYARSGDFSWFESEGGVDLMLKETAGSCSAIFEMGQIME